VGTVATVQLFTDYLVRLMKYVEFMKRVVPLHDDLFDFFYEALPGYEEVGRRRVLLGCWGSFQNPDVCDFRYETMADWGRAMYVTPGIVVDGELVTTDLVDINLGIRILLGSSFYDDWEGADLFVTKDPLGNPIDARHPWNQITRPRPQKRDLAGKYTWVMSPRWLDKRSGDHLALDTGGGPLARLWVTALAGKVDFGHVRSTGNSVKIRLPRTKIVALLGGAGEAGRAIAAACAGDAVVKGMLALHELAATTTPGAAELRDEGPLVQIRLPRREKPPGERCDLCSAAIVDEHRHLLDPKTRALACVCDPCAMLFHEPRPEARYVRVPR
jgi:hypothetical protein